MKRPFRLKIRFFASFLVLFGITAVYQNCGQVSFTAAPISENPHGAASIINPPPLNPDAPGTATTIRQFKPALAVRDISCLACHANIQANVVTDFGYGNDWYMNQGRGIGGYGATHYMPTTWQSIVQIRGQVIVPEATVSEAVVKGSIPANSTTPTASMSLLSFLTMKDMIDFSPNWNYQNWGLPALTNLSLTANVIAPPQVDPVISTHSVYIGAPTSKEILNLVSNSNSAPWVQTVKSSSTAAGHFSKATGVSGSSYIVNSDAIMCSGEDIVINGTLLLSNLKVYAENGGCRLYVNGPVFIEGPITYLNSASAVDATNNLQITSSQAIVMGVGINELNRRIVQDVRDNLFLRSAPTGTEYATFANSIMTEAKNIGSTLLVDASIPGTLPVSQSVGGETRAKIDFQHLLLNAPIIQSRYLGTITGVIVAETAQSSLGSFSFHYDSVFESVPVLPALPFDILCAGSSSATCNPAQP